MATNTLMLKSNNLAPIKALKQSQISFDASLRCIKPFSFSRSSFQFGSVHLKSNIITTWTPIGTKRPTASANPPSKLKASPSQFLNPSVSQDKAAINAVQKTLQWLRITVLVVALSLIMCRPHSALASSISRSSVGPSDLLQVTHPMSLSVFFTLFSCFFGFLSRVFPSNKLNNIIYIISIIGLLATFIMRTLQTTTNLQLGLCVNGRSLQMDLNRIAEITDDDSSDWKRILKKLKDSLLRNRKHWISAYYSLNFERSYEDGKEYFKILSSEDWRKHGLGTLFNLDDVERGSIVSQEADQCTNTYIVLTIFAVASRLLSILHLLEIPTITGCEDVEDALRNIMFVIEECHVKGVHVSWAPAKENDIQLLDDGVPRNYLRPPKFSYRY